MRSSTWKPTLAILAVVAVALALLMRPWSTPDAQAREPFSGTVIARVDGEPIYLEQAAFRAEGVSTAHQISSGITGTAEGQTPWPDLVLQSLADDVIIRREAEKLDVSIPLGNVLGYVNRVSASTGGPEAFDAWMKRQNLTPEQLEMRVYMNLLGAGVYLKVTDDVGITEKEVRDYFDKNRQQFSEPNDDLAFAIAHDELRSTLLKRRQDAAFKKWLDAQEAKPEYQIDVVEENWWNQLPAPSPAPTPTPTATPSPG